MKRRKIATRISIHPQKKKAVAPIGAKITSITQANRRLEELRRISRKLPGEQIRVIAKTGGGLPLNPETVSKKKWASIIKELGKVVPKGKKRYPRRRP
jgi:hypothetical protein